MGIMGRMNGIRRIPIVAWLQYPFITFMLSVFEKVGDSFDVMCGLFD